MLLVGVAMEPMPADAQEPLAVTAQWSIDQFRSGRESLEVMLSRRLDTGTERIAIVVGTTDVSAMLDVRGTRAIYRPPGVPLPSGQSDVVVYLVSAGEWTELERFPLNVRTRLGLDKAAFVPSADLSSDGQLDYGMPDGVAPPDRRTYQDLTMRFGAEGMLARSGWTIRANANALGVTQETQRLRFSEIQLDAPPVDLSDYRITVERGPAQVALGNLTVGSNPHLLSGFASRGASGGLRIGGVAAIDAGVVNGTNVVGWTNPFGISRSDHRLATVGLALELLPHRPGGIHLDVTAFDGSLLPLSSFNQGAATDAERSRGAGAQVTLSDPSQRMRFSGGYARSRFANPADSFLTGDTATVAVRTETRSARSGELSLHALRGFPVMPTVPLDVAVTVRHERIDPLYRSVGAYVQSDGENNRIDINMSVGPLALQGGASRARDNLDDIASILTTRTHGHQANGALPFGALVGAAPGAWYWPNLSATWQQMHQFGDAVPENGGFDPSHVPDQLSTNMSANLSWMHPLGSLSYSWNRSHQDNRQPGREQADFRTTVNAVSIGIDPLSRLSTSVDVSVERQRHFETGTVQELERVGGSARVNVTGRTALSGAVSLSRGLDPYAQQRTRNAEYNAEMSQGFALYGRHEGGTQGRIFIRYARARAAVRPFEQVSLIAPLITWTMTAGASFRLY